jgi:hypothetical protein
MAYSLPIFCKEWKGGLIIGGFNLE